MFTSSETGSDDLAMGSLLEEFTWDYLQTHEDLCQLQEFFIRSLSYQDQSDYPYHQMIGDLVTMLKKSMELQHKSGS